MGAGALPGPLLAGERDGFQRGRRPRLLVAGGDRLRLGGLVADLDAIGYESFSRAIQEDSEIGGGWEALVLDLRSWTAESIAWCHRVRKEGWLSGAPVILVMEPAQLPELHLREGLYDDFLEAPYTLPGLAARLHLLRWRTRRAGPDALEAPDLVVEPQSYRASLRGVPLELTYMEFELLKFLMSHPGKVFTRETILSRVWGYEYFGGVRTVDVHVRRLRAKLGEEHARFIETVRGVGYR
ncbi:MAG: winged helix-turn-helix domain-containing protein, partial [Actinomycetota bacterium]